MRVIIFGTGKKYLQNKIAFSYMEIVAYLDNDESKQGTIFEGKIVDHPLNVDKYVYDYILLVSIHYVEMRKQLLSLGVAEEKIIDKDHRGPFDNLHKIMKYSIGSERRSNKKIALVSHSMALTGAPLVLYNLALILKKNGYDVEVFADTEGLLLYEYLKEKISVTIFENFNLRENEIKSCFKDFDLIFVNTVTLYALVDKMKEMKCPIVWWLHEDVNVYEDYQITREALAVDDTVHVYGVGCRARSAFAQYTDLSKIENLNYGIPLLENKKSSRSQKDKLIFALIGTDEKRKGLDILVDSINKNKEKWSSRAEFWILGNLSLEGQNELIKVFGVVEHNQLMEMLDEVDVVVCPSRNDPMPVVLTEGFMKKKVCIASDKTGTAEYITPFYDGLICKTGDVDSLSDCIQWVLEHVKLLPEMGENAYKIYADNFSIEQFEKHVLQIVNKYI